MVSFNRIRISGSAFQTESWSTHFDIAKAEGTGSQAVVANYESLLIWATALSVDTYWDSSATLKNLVSASGKLNAIRIEYINNGVVEEAAEVDGLALVSGTTANFPGQNSIVCSLLTGRAGRSYKGRLYLPLWSGSIASSTGRLQSPTPGAVADFVKATFVEIITNGPVGSDAYPVVYSPKLNAVTPVTTFSVGNVIDTQRRRRDKLVEARTRVNW